MKKIYIITGSTSGIGKALLEYYSKDNIVFAGYRNEELKPQGENIIPFYVDYAKPETVQAAIDFINSKTDKVNTIINVAGCVVAGPVERIPMSELRRQFDVNVFGAVELTRGIVSVEKVLNISSMSSFAIFPFVAPYCASKRSLDILFNLFQLETNRHVKIVSLKLGSIATPIWVKSIKENNDALLNSKGFEAETKFLIENAKKNETKGASLSKTIKEIIKIETKNNPKPSYTIGFDAKVTEIFSHLPLGFQNFVIKQKLNKMKNLT